MTNYWTEEEKRLNENVKEMEDTIKNTKDPSIFFDNSVYLLKNQFLKDKEAHEQEIKELNNASKCALIQIKKEHEQKVKDIKHKMLQIANKIPQQEFNIFSYTKLCEEIEKAFEK